MWSKNKTTARTKPSLTIQRKIAVVRRNLLRVRVLIVLKKTVEARFHPWKTG